MTDLYLPPLGPTDIRLLTIVGKDDEGTLQCRLVTVSRHEAIYDALSYTWGRPDLTAEVICNGVKVTVPPSLAVALDYLEPYQRESQRPIWIDAICLNQNDASEIQRQVPLMSEVYHHANGVVVWLGEAVDNSDDVFDRIPQFRSELTAFRQSGRYGFPSPEDRFWPDLGKLLHRPWFERLWTLQETVLAKQKIVICGTQRFDWTEFTDFLDLTNAGGCRETINQQSIRDPFRVNAFVSVGHANTIANLMHQGGKPGTFLLSALNLARYRQCLHDVDHVYAILGVFPPTIRADINEKGLINYSLTPGELFTKITRNYLMTVDVGLELLSLAGCCTSTRRPALPSWCPDWAIKPNVGRFLSMIPSYKAGIPPPAQAQFDSSTAAMPLLTPGKDESQLYAQGFRIDEIKRVGIPWHPSGGNGAVTADDEQQLRCWEESCRAVAAETIIPRTTSLPTTSTTTPFLPTYVRTMIGNVTGVAPPEPYTDDFCGEYEQFKHLNECPDEPCSHVTPDPARYRSFCAALGQNCTGRAFFSTKAGRVGMGPSGMKEADLVYILLGGRPVYVLRPRADSSTDGDGSGGSGGEVLYELVGDAYVDGLMDGEGFTCAQRGKIERCCLT